MALFYPGSILSLHRSAAQRLISAGNGDAALLYLCLLGDRDGAALKWDAPRLEAARTALVSLKLLAADTPVAPAPAPKLEDNTPPDYSTQDITQALQGGDFQALVPEVERRLGKLLSPADLKSLYFIYDYLALPAEVILLLLGWCIQQEEEKHPGRRPTLPQMKREASRWQKAGACDLDSAEAYLQRRSRLNTRGREILHLLGRGDRPAVPKEEVFLDSWSQLPFPDETLTLAYERTLFHVGKFNWSYMNGILLSWHKQGLHTPEAILASEERSTPRVSARPTGPKAPSPTDPQGETPIDTGDIRLQADQWTPEKEVSHGIQ